MLPTANGLPHFVGRLTTTTGRPFGEVSLKPFLRDRCSRTGRTSVRRRWTRVGVGSGMGSLLDELRAAAGEPRTVTVPHHRSVVVALYVAADALRARRRALNVDDRRKKRGPPPMLPRHREGCGHAALTRTAYVASGHDASSIGRAGQSGAWAVSGSPSRHV